MVKAYVSHAGKKMRIRVASTWEKFIADLKQKFKLNPEDNVILLDHNGVWACQNPNDDLHGLKNTAAPDFELVEIGDIEDGDHVSLSGTS